MFSGLSLNINNGSGLWLGHVGRIWREHELRKNIKNMIYGLVKKVTDALIYPLDNIYIRFGSKLYRQNVGIPM